MQLMIQPVVRRVASSTSKVATVPMAMSHRVASPMRQMMSS